jgi:hypothetical protein
MTLEAPLGSRVSGSVATAIASSPVWADATAIEQSLLWVAI